ncbi:hypothetical protein MPDQ_003888 [Monascus purpureus]|uniref:Uncharacterized protein n=1 Tax=Monascus purpureus TaxID=5098 RepID=A0A507QMH0_MONPU|nr:hypothetical protein MPDQ_003888 [Monascus purpureus]BDD64305.1 hypothetical protein MAP00_009136 [Monascus purpureus]
MTDKTFYLTREDLRKSESRSSQLHDGRTPGDANVSTLKSYIDRNVDKRREIDENKSNLPLPDQPPVPSDWQSSDSRGINVGTGGVEGPISGEGNSALRQPATAVSSARVSGEELGRNTEPGEDVGRQGKDHLDRLPKDARAW